MEPTQHTYRVLLVSAAEKFTASLLGLLPAETYAPVCVATDTAAARRMALEQPFDLAIINSPLPDDFGVRLALDLCDGGTCGVLLLVKAEHASEITARVAPYGVLTLAKPTSAAMLTQTLTLLCGTHERLCRMEARAASIEEKMEEIRIVNRAKCILIEQLRMTEQEAHRYIEKQAMNRCVTKRAIAEGILSTYK